MQATDEYQCFYQARSLAWIGILYRLSGSLCRGIDRHESLLFLKCAEVGEAYARPQNATEYIGDLPI